MRRRRWVVLCLGLAGCGGGSGTPDAGPIPIEGGAVNLPAPCGYRVTTRPGASAPVGGTPVLGADPAPRQLHLGLAADPARTVVVSWRTDPGTLASTVRFGTSATLDQAAEGLTFVYVPPSDQTTEVRLHEAHLCGLAPDTEYRYQVGGADGDDEAWSPVYSFRTAPDGALTPDAEVTILALGDVRGGIATWGRVIAQARATVTPDLVLFSGDAVLLGTKQDEWDEFLDAAEPLFREAPVLMAHGNHEVNAINYYTLFALPGDEEHYALDVGTARLAVVNDSPAEPAEIEAIAAPFLDGALAADAPWKLALHHRSLYSSAVNHGSDARLQAAFGPIYDAHAVNLVLTGHDHDYERTQPIRGGVAGSGTTYVVAGSAGADLYEVGRSDFTEVIESTHSFVVLRIRRGQLALDAYRDDGTLLDSFTLTKP